jgi:predicted RNA-binding Zn-ribbon protein involved in translation (DUF1610 family)
MVERMRVYFVQMKWKNSKNDKGRLNRSADFLLVKKMAYLYCLCTGSLTEMIETSKEINIVGGYAFKYKCPECGKEVYEAFEYSGYD